MVTTALFLCPICNRYHNKDNMTFHHLLPVVGNKEKGDQTIYICKTCHSVIHFCLPNEVLRYKFNTLESIKQYPPVLDMVNIYKYKADNCIFKIKKLKKQLQCA